MAIVWTADTAEVGVDWGKGKDETVYRCSCGFHTKQLEQFVQHVSRRHRAGVRIVTTVDQVRR